jgi:hypothetical protein
MWEVEVVGGNTLTESNVHYGNTPQSLDQEAHLGYSYGDPAAPGDFDAHRGCKKGLVSPEKAHNTSV